MEFNNIESNKTKKPFNIFTFNAAYVAPEYKWNKKNNFVEWGVDNMYPNFLLRLYNYEGSTIHKSAINKKIKLSTGYGFKDTGNPQLDEFLKRKKVKEVLKKCDADFEIYNGYCFEIVYNNEGGIYEINHVPIHKIRRGIIDEKDPNISFPHFLYSKDWAKYKKEEEYHPQIIKEYDPTDKVGRQLFYYMEPNPESEEIYPICNYTTGINFIAMDYEIGKFHLNQVKQGFQPSFILNFATGIPSVEEQDEFYRDFNRNYAGTGNGGKAIITYSEGTEQAPTLTPIQLNDSDERFIMLRDLVESAIVNAHEIPPQLVILTPGKLGSTDERVELLSEFQSYYITPRQEQLEYGFNKVFEELGYGEDVIELYEYSEVQKINTTITQ